MMGARLFARGQGLSYIPSGCTSHLSLRAQRKVTQRKGTRRSCGIRYTNAVPCVARNPAAGVNSHIHVLKHPRLFPPASCATRHDQRASRANRLGKPFACDPRTACFGSPTERHEIWLEALIIPPTPARRSELVALACTLCREAEPPCTSKPFTAYSPCRTPSNAASFGGKARMFEHMDVRVRAGPKLASSTGNRRRAAAAA